MQLIQSAYPFYGGPLDGEWRTMPPAFNMYYSIPVPYWHLPKVFETTEEAMAAPLQALEGRYDRYTVHSLGRVTGLFSAYVYVLHPFHAQAYAERWEFDLFGLVERDGNLCQCVNWKSRVDMSELYK